MYPSLYSVHVKMKDSSVYSFREPEGLPVQSVIRKDEKDHTIISRQIEEFDRVPMLKIRWLMRLMESEEHTKIPGTSRTGSNSTMPTPAVRCSANASL